MRIINNENEEKYVVCEKCKTKIGYTQDDIEYKDYGVPYIRCPHCSSQTMLEEEDCLELNKNNVKFPIHYYHFGEGKPIDDEQINKWVKESIEYLEKNPTEHFSYHASGDSIVFVIKYEDDEEYSIIVAKNYYSTSVSIDKEEKSNNKQKETQQNKIFKKDYDNLSDILHDLDKVEKILEDSIKTDYDIIHECAKIFKK